MAADENRALVETFFNVMWNTWDDATMREILSPDVDFRGSIGLHVTGHDGFAGYMRTIRDAFPDFHNAIEEIVATDTRAVARLTYTGTHAGPLLGHPASGRRIEYAGVAMFT
ncbi:MAG: ester cyclase, partial [Alphaproteobacteria bacterium]|nr:ester cyclase [Alphaproteobacteria bacterium]